MRVVLSMMMIPVQEDFSHRFSCIFVLLIDAGAAEVLVFNIMKKKINFKSL